MPRHLWTFRGPGDRAHPLQQPAQRHRLPDPPLGAGGPARSCGPPPPLHGPHPRGGAPPGRTPRPCPLPAADGRAQPFPSSTTFAAGLVLKLLVALSGDRLLLPCHRRGPRLVAAGGRRLLPRRGLFLLGAVPRHATMAWVPWLAAGVIRLLPPSRAAGDRHRRRDHRSVLTPATRETPASADLRRGLRHRSAPEGTGLARGLARRPSPHFVFGLAAPQLSPSGGWCRTRTRRGDAGQNRPFRPVHLTYPPSWFQRGYASFVLAPVSRMPTASLIQAPSTPDQLADSEPATHGLVAFAAALSPSSRPATAASGPSWERGGGPAAASRFLPPPHLPL